MITDAKKKAMELFDKLPNKVSESEKIKEQFDDSAEQIFNKRIHIEGQAIREGDDIIEVQLRGHRKTANKFDEDLNMLQPASARDSKQVTENDVTSSVQESKALLPEPEQIEMAKLPVKTKKGSAQKNNEVGQQPSQAWNDVPFNLGEKCDRGHVLTVVTPGGNFQPYGGTCGYYCNFCTNYHDLAKMEVKYHCKECGYDLCRTCCLTRNKQLKEEYTLPINPFPLKQVKNSEGGFQTCKSPFLSGPDLPASWLKCESGINDRSSMNDILDAGGYMSEENGFYFCTKCMIKWSQFKFNPNHKYHGFNINKSIANITAEEKIHTINTVEEDNKILKIEVLKPHDIYNEQRQQFLEKIIRPKCMEKILLLKPYTMTKEDTEKKMCPDEGINTKNQSLTVHDFMLLQFEKDYIPLMTCCDYISEEQYHVNRVITILDKKKNFEIQKQILLEQVRLADEQNFSSLNPSFVKFRSALYYYKRTYEVEEAKAAPPAQSTQASNQISKTHGNQTETAKDSKKDEEPDEEEPEAEAEEVKFLLSKIISSKLSLHRLNLKTLHETPIEGFDIQDTGETYTHFFFSRQIGNLHVAYFKQTDEEGGNSKIVKEAHADLDEAILIGKQGSLRTQVAAGIVVDAHSFEIVWRSKSNSTEDEKELVDHAIKEGYLLNGDDHEPPKEEEDDPYGDEYDYEGGDDEEDEEEAEDPNKIHDWEVALLKKQVIMKQKLYSQPPDPDSEKKEPTVCELVSLSDLKKTIKQFEIQANCLAQCLYRYDRILQNPKLGDQDLPYLQQDESELLVKGLERRATLAEAEEEQKMVDKQTYIFFDTCQLFHFDHYPNDEKLNKEGEAKELKKAPTKVEKKDGEEEVKEKNFQRIGKNLKIFKCDSYSDGFAGNHLDVQEKTIKIKMPGEQTEKSFKQYFMCGQNYFESSPLLLYPAFDPDLGYDPFGNVASLNSSGADEEMKKMLLNYIIMKNVNKQIWGGEGEDYVGSLIKCINDGTSHVRHRQLFSRKGMLQLELESIVKNSQLASSVDRNASSQVWLRTGRFHSTLFVNYKQYNRNFYTLTFQTNNEIAQALGPTQKIPTEKLRQNPQKVQEIIDLHGLSEEESKDLSTLSTLQMNIMKYAQQQGYSSSYYYNINSHYQNVVYKDTEILHFKHGTNDSERIHLNPENRFLIESPYQGYGNFSSIKIAQYYEYKQEEGKDDKKEKKEAKQELTDEEADLGYFEMQTHLRSNKHYIFLCKFYYSYYFFVIKTIDEVKQLENRKDKALLTENSEIYTVEPENKTNPIDKRIQLKKWNGRDFFKQVRDDKLSRYQNLVFQVQRLRDMKFTSEYFPFTMHDSSEDRTHLVFIGFDFKMPRIVSISIQPSAEMWQFFSHYWVYLCRSSERVYSKTHPHLSFTKYQVATKYTELNDRLNVNEYAFIENHKTKEVKLKLTGVREVLLSQNLSIDLSDLNICIYPYYGTTGTHLQGTQVCFRDYYKQDAHFFVIYDEQFGSHQYKYKSKLVKFGYQKFFFEINGEKDHTKYALLLNSCMRSRFIFHDYFDLYEMKEMLQTTTNSLMTMVPFNFENFMLYDENMEENTPDKGRDYFFRSFEFLAGKSICDVFIKDPKKVVKALALDQEKVLPQHKSLLLELQGNDQELWDKFLQRLEDCRFYQAKKMMRMDFNFVSVIERSYQLRSSKVAEIFLEFIFQTSTNPQFYQPLIMQVLPLILKSSTVPLASPFLNPPDSDAGDKTCSLENRLVSNDLPLFSFSPLEQFKFKDYYDFENYEKELVNFIQSHTKAGDEDSFKKDEDLTVHEQIIAQLKRAEKKQQAESGELFTLDHSYIDLRKLILGEKLRSDFTWQLQFDDFYLSRLINSVESEEFFNQSSIRKIIDFQFTTTKVLAQVAFWLYLIGFVIPFCLTILHPQAESSIEFAKSTHSFFEFHPVKFCYAIGFIPQVFFLIVELVQLKQQKMNYFTKNYWNFFDFFQIFHYMILIYFHTDIIFDEENWKYQEFIIIMMRLLILFEAFVKIQYFIRIYESFGFLVQMVLLTMQEVIPFTVFLAMWVGLFAQCYIILMVHIENNPDSDDEVDYPYVNRPVRFMIQSYRNSIGDINAPDYDVWAPEGDNDSFGTLKYTMIYIIWLIWFGNQFVNLIILLNFLIAVISQTYEKVISQQQTHNYLHKSQLNEEIYQMGKLFGMTKPFKIMAFSMDKEESQKEDDEWMGFMQSMKKHVTKSNAQVLKKMEGYTSMLMEQMEKNKKEMDEFKLVSMASQEKIMGQLKELLASQPAKKK